MENARVRKPGETPFVLLLLLLSLFLFWQAYRIAGFSGLSSPGAFPLAATGAMVVSGAIALVRTLRMPAGETGSAAFRQQIVPTIVGTLAALIMLYGAVLESLGFLISSFLFLFSATWLLHRRGPVVAALSALASIALIYVIFRLIFSVILPEGVIPERQIIATITDFLTGRTR